MFPKYPYLDLSDRNLDFLTKAIREMENEVRNFVSLNAVKYANPIQWNINRQYEKNTIAIDPLTGTAFISVQPVPNGVALTRTQYWTPVFDLSQFVTKAASNFANTYERDITTTATMSTGAGDWVVWDSTLYVALNAIHAGDAYVVGGNIKRMTVEDFFDLLMKATHNLDEELDTEIRNRTNADNTLQQNIDAEAQAREDADGILQDNIDAEAQAREDADRMLQDNIDTTTISLSAKIGDLEQLNTTNKNNIVAAINSIVASSLKFDFVTPQDFGAVGDGVTNDTAAVQSAFDSGKCVKFISDYAVTTVTWNRDESFIDFAGYQLIGISRTNDYVLEIYESMYNVFNNIKITIAPESRPYYYGAIRIYSSSNKQSQFNIFNGMYLKECWHGIVWGAKEGEASVSNAQSETFINNFRTRSVSVPFLGNQDNGYLTFIGGVFDVNQYETWDDTRFSFDSNRCVVNHVGKVDFIGCEFAATVNVEHIGFVGRDIHVYDSILEICGTQAFITGDFSLINWYNGYIGQASKTPFIVNNGAKGTVIIANGSFHHGGVVAPNNLLYGYDAPETQVYLTNVTYADTPYALDMFGNLNVKCSNFVISADNITLNDEDITGLSLIDNNSSDPLAFGEQYNCLASFDSIFGKRGIAVQFTGGTEGGYYTPMIPIYGGTLYHANSCGFTDGNNVYVYLEFYDSNDSYLGAELLQTINGVRLNRCKLQYAPTNAKKCRIRITNDTNAPQVYTITCNIALYWKRRV